SLNQIKKTATGNSKFAVFSEELNIAEPTTESQEKEIHQLVENKRNIILPIQYDGRTYLTTIDSENKIIEIYASVGKETKTFSSTFMEFMKKIVGLDWMFRSETVNKLHNNSQLLALAIADKLLISSSNSLRTYNLKTF